MLFISIKIFNNKIKMVFPKINTISAIIISFLLFQINSSYILLPFIKNSSEPLEDNFTIEDLSEFYVDPKFTSTIEIGDPPQKVELILSPDKFGLSMVEDINTTIKNLYNKATSSSIRITNSYDSYFCCGENIPVILNETIYFPLYNNNNEISKVKIGEYPFVYLTKIESKQQYENKKTNLKEDGKAYMILGTKVQCNKKNEICDSLPHFLKHEDIINTHSFNVIYNPNQKNGKENYDLSFMIGSELHQTYPDKYDKDNLKYTNALSYMGEINWIIKFDEVFYFPEGFKLDIDIDAINDYNQISTDINLQDKKIHYSNDISAKMAFDLDIILCPKFYFFSINKTFFSNHTDQCQINFTKKKYTIIVCDKDFNTDSFPSIFFYHKELNHTFILTQKELFTIKGNKKYFLIVYDLFRPTFWMLGKVFLQKYSFNYDMENKRIGFYKTEKNSYQSHNMENTNTGFTNFIKKNLIWFGITLIVGIIGFFIGKFLYKQIRKKKAYELDDNYDYSINGEKNILDNEKGNSKNDNFIYKE